MVVIQRKPSYGSHGTLDGPRPSATSTAARRTPWGCFWVLVRPSA